MLDQPTVLMRTETQEESKVASLEETKQEMASNDEEVEKDEEDQVG